MQWKTVRIFISSTFNDMHAERDYLVKYVFPELSLWCEKRKLRLIDIDLRWGVSTADSMANNTVLACLNNIDESRPFFLCFLGQRRGWVPESEDISESTYKSYPSIGEYVGKSSVTEMEIEHALLQPMLRIADGKNIEQQPVKHALFFFRNDPFTNVALSDVHRKIYTNSAAADQLFADRELSSFKEKVRSRWDVCDYDCRWDESFISPELQTEGEGASDGRLTDFKANGAPLKEVVIAALKREIELEFPDNCASDEGSQIERELEQQEQFIIHCSEGFIPRYNDFCALNEYISSQSRKLFILTAQSGLGKSTLLANFVLLADRSHRSITARFCCASDLSSSQFGLWKSIFDQHGIKYKGGLEEIKRDIVNLLSQLSGILIIDGINQLPNGIDMLSWLPRELPDGLKLIISLKDDALSSLAIEAVSQNAIIHKIEPFFAYDDKKSLIDEYLKHYLKKLDDSHIEAICRAKSSKNPLFLKVVLSSLRVFGSYKQLDTEILAFGEEPVSAFDEVLSGLEQDTSYVTKLPGKMCVSLLFGLLACARRGLTEDELAFCFRHRFPDADEEMIRCALRVYLRRVRVFSASREGRTDFLYESFRIAADKRYRESRYDNHKLLAACFSSCCYCEGTGSFLTENPRALTELLYHLCQSDIHMGEKLLTNCAYINARCSACGSGELISDYDFLPELNSNTKKFRDLLIRFSDIFTKYKNSFFSTALSCDFAQAWDIPNTPGRPLPHIIPERLALPPYCQTSADAAGLQLKISAAYKLDKTVAVCIPQNAAFAIFSEGIGRLRLIYTDTMTPDEKVIATARKRPLGIFASSDGGRIAVTYDDGTAEVIRLFFNGSTLAASQSELLVDYYLPMFSDAVFAFDHDCLWYQKDLHTIVKLSVDGEAGIYNGGSRVSDGGTGISDGEARIYLPEEGDVTALAVGEGINVFAIKTPHGAKLYREDEGKALIMFELPECEILGITVLKDGNIAVASSDATIRLLDANGSEKNRINTGMSCALLLEIDSGILCIAESRRNAFLWDMKESLKSGEFAELEHNRKISAAYDGQLIRVISDQHVITASVTEEMAMFSILLSVFFNGDDLIRVFGECSGKQIIVLSGGQSAKVHLDAGILSILKVNNDLIIFDQIGNMATVDLIQLTVYKRVAQFKPVSATPAKDGYYCADTSGFLHQYPEGIKLPSLSDYWLSSISLHVFGDLLVLTGISVNARAVNNSTPYLMLLYRINEDKSLRLICERYFPKDRGMFIDCCFSENDGMLYVFFSTPYSGSDITIPTVSCGTADEFAGCREKSFDIPFERKNNSFCVSQNTLFVCGGGVISAYKARSLKYLASIASDGGFRLLVRRDGDRLLALGGSSDIYSLKVNYDSAN